MKTLKEIFDLNRLSTILLYTSIITFIIAFNFSDNPPAGGWQQQFLPFMNNRPLSDITFVDSLTGFGITGDHTANVTNYVIKTTNGGDNWFVVDSIYQDLTKVNFINTNTGFVCGGLNQIGGYLTKTTNSGKNWNVLSTPFGGSFQDLFVLNEDTLWVTSPVGGGFGGLYRTINGGVSWIRQDDIVVNKIYMLNGLIGFISLSDVSYLAKTTNGGFNWTFISNQNGFRDIYFADSLTGWKVSGSMKKTTDGGLTWQEQTLPVTSTTSMREFSHMNSDTMWGVGGVKFFPGIGERGIIYKTTNGGINWGYQIPDTTINIFKYFYCNFVDRKNGWCNSTIPLGVHTVNGGDTVTIYSGISNNSVNISDVFSLYQNYPNPFNPKTIISYELETSSFVSIKVFDILGKEIKELINKKQNPGKYEIDFDGYALSSGIYFYSMFVNGNRIQTKKMMLQK
ncbi:MAG: T9SS type A sorting domain-containing protein [Ignavibacteria bacterium]|nr:T9SS type A sorting domain-containing protein [Ignavibacteria bacterium]